MLFVVVIVFAVSWLPMQTFSMVQFLYPEIRENIGYQSFEYNIFVCAYFVSHWLSMAHSCLNPLIYCFMNDKFRTDLQALICKRGAGNGNCGGAGSEHFVSSQVRSPFSKAQGSLFGQVASELAGESGQQRQQQQQQQRGAISLRRSSPSSRDQLASRCSGGATDCTNKSTTITIATGCGYNTSGSVTLAATSETGAETEAAQSQVNGSVTCPIIPANSSRWASTSTSIASPSSSSSLSPNGNIAMGADNNKMNLEQLAGRQVGETSLFVKVLRGRQQLFVYESSLEGEMDIKEEEEDDEFKPEVGEEKSNGLMMIMGNHWRIKEEV